MYFKKMLPIWLWWTVFLSSHAWAYTLSSKDVLYVPIVNDDITLMITFRPSEVLSPVNNSKISGTLTLKFSEGSGVDRRYVKVYYANRTQHLLSKWLDKDQKTLSVSLPKDGKYVDVELYSYIADKYFVKKYRFKQTIDPIAIISPFNGTHLESSVLSLIWNASSSVTDRYLRVGTSGYGSEDIFKGNLSGTSRVLYGLPRDGERVYVVFYSRINGRWYSRKYSFIATDAKQRTVKFVKAYLSGDQTYMKGMATQALLDRLKRNDARVRAFFKNIVSYHKLLYFHDYQAMIIAKTRDGKEVVFYLGWNGQRWVLTSIS